MDASDRVSFEDCPTCRRPPTWAWLDADLNELDCLDCCERFALRPAQTPVFVGSRDGDAIAGVEVLVALFEQAILDTAATYGLADPREAASLVADAWTDVLHAEGRSPRLVESASAAVREIGDRMRSRQPR
jgi:hypothetical protein